MHFCYIDNPCKKVDEEDNSVFRAGVEYCAVTDRAHKNGAECD